MTATREAGLDIEAPVLIADIGGTNARFAVVGKDGAITPLSDIKNRDFDTVEAAVAHALSANIGPAPVTAVFAIACPVNAETFRLTNADWEVEPARLIESCKLNELRLMNDFLAQGLAAVSLGMDDLLQLGGAERSATGPRVIIGPGTGLGVALAFNVDGRWKILPGEGGHRDLGPRTPDEFAIWPYLQKRQGRMEAEMAVSGPGLQNLYGAILQKEGKANAAESAESITRLGLMEGDPCARKALEMMASFLARICSDLAITTMSHGGVYLCGGMVKHLSELLGEPEFRNAFEDKHPVEAVMHHIPVFAVRRQNSGLYGIAEYLRSPGRYLLDGNIACFFRETG